MMELIDLFSFSKVNILEATTWTLLHSIWQGIVLSVVAGIIMLATKKSKAELRYNLLLASLISFLCVVAFSFYNELDSNSKVLTKKELKIHSIYYKDPVITNSKIVYFDDMSIQIIDFINQYANWIFFIWSIIIFLKFIKLSTGLYGIYKIRNFEVLPVEEKYEQVFSDLCDKLNLKKQIHFLQSEKITVPSVFGFFKPVILFPAAMLTSIPMQEIEAILLHELGHIKRNDFIVNILQNIIEIIFFFNPAILWVSGLLRAERENCCDEISLSRISNKKEYLMALLKFEQFNLKQKLIPNFSDQKNHLKNRVERIVYNQNKTLNILEKRFLSVSLVLVSICLFAFGSIKAQNDAIEAQPTEPSELSNIAKATNSEVILSEFDAISVYKVGGYSNLTGVSNTFVDGKAYKIFVENSSVTAMYIDGKKISAEKIISHKQILDEIFKGIVANSRKSRQANEQSEREPEQIRINREQSARDSEQTKLASEQSARNSEHAGIINEHSARESKQTMNAMIDDFIENKIIKNRKNLHSFRFNADELVVNGKRQSSEIHNKFKTLYETSNSWSWVQESGTFSGQSEIVKPINPKRAVQPIQNVTAPTTPIRVHSVKPLDDLGIIHAGSFGLGHKDKTNPTTKIHTTQGGKEYDIIIKNDSVSELYINGKRIDDNKIIDYKPVINKILEEVRINKEKSKKDEERAKKEEQDSEYLSQNLIQDFIRENIIKNDHVLKSYKLSSRELIVNGQKQPAEIHQKFKTKYVKRKGWVTTMVVD